MTEQPTTLRLACELEACPTINYKDHAAELRRLHALNGELLEALDKIAINTHDDTAERVARAAIARAEGEKK